MRPMAQIAVWGGRGDHNARRNTVSSRNDDGASSASCSRRGYAVASRSISESGSDFGTRPPLDWVPWRRQEPERWDHAGTGRVGMHPYEQVTVFLLDRPDAVPQPGEE